MKIAFRQLCVPLCGRFGPDEGGVAGYVDRIGTKYAAKWGVQMAGMNFQTRSRAYIYKNREKGKTSTRDGRIFSTLDRLISAILSPTASVMIPPHALKLDSMVSVTKGSM